LVCRRSGLALLLLLLCGVAPAHAEPTKQVIGWVERVAIYPGNLVVRARIDTGAKTASLNCDCVQAFERRDGQNWVRFSVVNSKGETVSLERRVVRTVTIRQHFGDKQRRPVIRLGLCLAGVYKEVDVNLVDRSGFNYQMLIGRNFLKDGFLVDAARTFLSTPRCSDAPSGQ
ncbi:MAG: RimK/LysX family protein, partial [Acidihalobacter sp.]